jgi:hypothetical protein
MKTNKNKKREISWLARWDCDRYLHATFTLAFSYFKPTMTIFLGDLFDEGLSATDVEFDSYFRRFKSIYNKAMVGYNGSIYLAGDNDIGGEYSGDRKSHLEKRFEKYFGTNLVDTSNFNSLIRFVKLDVDYSSISNYDQRKRQQVKNKLKNDHNNYKHTFVLNHMTFLNRPINEIDNVIHFFILF